MDKQETFIPVDVYTNGREDCSANGVSFTHAKKLAVKCKDGWLTRQDIEKHGYKVLVTRKSSLPAHFNAPDVFVPEGETYHTMSGGNFAYSTDSRFTETYGYSPLKIHDRIER